MLGCSRSNESPSAYGALAVKRDFHISTATGLSGAKVAEMYNNAVPEWHATGEGDGVLPVRPDTRRVEH